MNLLVELSVRVCYLHALRFASNPVLFGWNMRDVRHIARSAAPLNSNCQDFLQWTPLHYAVDHSSLACIKALLTLGQASPAVEDEFHVTPYSLALEKNVEPVLRMLKESMERLSPNDRDALEASAAEVLRRKRGRASDALDIFQAATAVAVEQTQTTEETDSKLKQEMVGLTMNVAGLKMRVRGPRVYSTEYIPASELRKVYRK